MPIYAGLDKNREQISREMALKKPRLPLKGSPRAGRSRIGGGLSLQWEELAKLIARPTDATQVRWNTAAILDGKLDEQDLVAAAERCFQRRTVTLDGQHAVWSCRS